MFDLKRFRKDRNLGQKDIAPVLNVGQAFISQVENGIDPMPDEWINILKKEYQIEDIGQYIIEDKPSDCSKMKMLIEMYQKGEIYSAAQVEKIGKLYEEIAELKAKLNLSGEKAKSQNPGEEMRPKKAG